MTATTPTCVCCGRPTADGYACHADALSLAQKLREAAGHAEDAWTVLARQARYGTGGSARKPEAEPARSAEVNRRNPVAAFGWQASVERPKAGGLRAEPIPVDLGASERLGDVANTITAWARHVCETRGTELPARRPQLGPLCAGTCEHGPLCAGTCEHDSCAGIQRRLPPSALGEAAAWLATQVDWLRKRPEAGEAFDELTDACTRLRALVDRPATQALVGMCDCGKVLYAPDGRTVVQCPEKLCQMVWHVARSRDILRDALREKLFTAAEAGHLAAYWDERTSEQIRKLISMWVQRGRLTAHGWIAGSTGTDEERSPTYRFGDVIDRLANTPRRTARAAEDERVSA